MSVSGAKLGLFSSSLFRPSRWLWTLVPLVLSLSFVSGAFIAVDSSQVAAVKAAVDSVPVDFIGRGTSDDFYGMYVIENRIQYMESVDGVEEIEPAVVMTHVLVQNSAGSYPPYYTGDYRAAMFVSPGNDRMMASYSMIGYVPEPGTIALPLQMADDLDVGVGDVITLTFAEDIYVYNPAANTSMWLSEEVDHNFTISQIWTQDGMKDQITHFGSYSQQYLDVDERAVLFRQYLNPVILNLQDLYFIVDSFGYGILRDKYVVEDSESLYLIWIDRGQFIDYLDADGSVERLDVLYGPMSSQYLAYGVTVSRSELVYELGAWNADQLEEDRLFYIGLSVPVLALGVYVTGVGAGIGADLSDEKLRSLGAQGVRRRTVLGRLTLGSVVGGLIAGAVSVLLGIVTSRMLLTPVENRIAWNLEGLGDWDFAISLFTVLAVLGLGVLVFLVATLFAWLRATRPTQVGPSAREFFGWLRFAEILMIALSVVSIIGILGGQRWHGSHGYDYYIYSFSAIVQNFGVVIFPAVPFMLSIAVVSLLTRWPVSLQRRMTNSFSRGSKDLVFPLGPLADRCDKRARRMCVLVSLALAFGLFVTIAMDTVLSDEDAGSEAEDLSQFLDAEFVALVATVLVGVAIATYANSRIAMSALVKSGSSGVEQQSARTALWTEALSLTLIGAVVGISVGLFASYLFGMLWVPGFEEPPESIGMVLTSSVAVVIVVSFLLLVVLSIVSSLRGSSHMRSDAIGQP